MAKDRELTEKEIQINTFLYQCVARMDPKDITLELCKQKFDNADVNTASAMLGGVTMLMIASQYGKDDIVEWLLEEKKANVNLQTTEGNTALDCALSRDGNGKIIMLLLQNGAESNDSHIKKPSDNLPTLKESDGAQGVIKNLEDAFYEAEDESEDLAARLLGHILRHDNDLEEEN